MLAYSSISISGCGELPSFTRLRIFGDAESLRKIMCVNFPKLIFVRKQVLHNSVEALRELHCE